jgi:Holliday junction resolvase RusA-like endonuclease
LGKHWSAKAREKLNWMEEIRAAGGTEQAKVKMRVTITIHNARQYDRDNAWGACKPILDAMKQLGLIVDDRAAYCELEVKQEKSTRKDKRTVIQVEPV